MRIHTAFSLNEHQSKKDFLGEQQNLMLQLVLANFAAKMAMNHRLKLCINNTESSSHTRK